jgi:hypothetical protein
MEQNLAIISFQPGEYFPIHSGKLKVVYSSRLSYSVMICLIKVNIIPKHKARGNDFGLGFDERSIIFKTLRQVCSLGG